MLHNRFGLLRFRSPLLAQSLLFSSPKGNEMFQFPSFAFRVRGMTQLHCAGLPHSEIPGSMVICTFPELIAAYHVLHRLPEPRHPPFALILLFFLYRIACIKYIHYFSFSFCFLLLYFSSFFNMSKIFFYLTSCFFRDVFFSVAIISSWLLREREKFISQWGFILYMIDWKNNLPVKFKLTNIPLSQIYVLFLLFFFFRLFWCLPFLTTRL